MIKCLKTNTVIDQEDGTPILEDYFLTASQKKTLLLRSYQLGKDSKVQQAIVKEFTKTKSYGQKLFEISIDTAKPENKEKWFNEYLDGSKMSKEEYLTSMTHFYYWNSQDILEKYANRFYENIETIFKTKHRDYAEIFITHLTPINLARPEDKEKLDEIYARTDSTNTHFRKMLNLQIEKTRPNDQNEKPINSKSSHPIFNLKN
jgi:hypothetical protein